MRSPFEDERRRRLYLVRHDESAATRESDGLYGDDIVLTGRSLAQAAAMADAPRDVPFRAAYSSDIARAPGRRRASSSAPRDRIHAVGSVLPAP